MTPPTNGSNRATSWVSTWAAPALVLGLCSMAFSAGLYVGRSEVRVELTELKQGMIAHVSSPTHHGSVGSDVLELRFNEILRRLEDIEKDINSINGGAR